MKTIRAISLWQPYASLWCSGIKKHETRHWTTEYRGPLLVHAAKRRIDDFDPRDPVRAICEDQWGGHYPVDLPRGAIVGLINLSDVFRTESIENEDTDDFYCGDFSDGRFGWLATDATLFKTPIPYRGQQGFFSVAHDLVAAQIGSGP